MNAQQEPALSDRIKDAREARGWSQARLAREAGVAENTVLNAESGHYKTRPSKRRAILDALGMAEIDRTIDTEGLPDDVLLFLRHAAARLSAMSEDARGRLLGELYPQIIGPASEVRVRAAEIVRKAEVAGEIARREDEDDDVVPDESSRNIHSAKRRPGSA